MNDVESTDVPYYELWQKKAVAPGKQTLLSEPEARAAAKRAGMLETRDCRTGDAPFQKISRSGELHQIWTRYIFQQHTPVR